MADNDIDFFIMDGIQTFPPSEPEPVPTPDFRPTVLRFPSTNAPALNRYQDPQIRPSANYHQPVAKLPPNYQFPLLRPPSNYQHFPLKPFVQQPLTRPLNYQQPMMNAFPTANHFPSSLSAREIIKPRDSVFCSAGIMDSGSRYAPSAAPVVGDIPNGDCENDFSFLSAIPSKVAEINPSERAWPSNNSSTQEPISDEVFCSTGLVSSPYSNSEAIENGIEADERTISPPLNFVNMQQSINNFTGGNTVRCSGSAVPQNTADGKKTYSSMPINFVDIQQMESTNNSDKDATVEKLEISPNDFMLVNSSVSSNEFKLMRRPNFVQKEYKGITPQEHIKDMKKSEADQFKYEMKDRAYSKVISLARNFTTSVPASKSEGTSVNKPTPTSVNRPTPTSVSRPTPASVSRPTPASVSRPTPASVSRPTPASVSRPTPASVSRPTPTSVSKPTPTSVNRPIPTSRNTTVRTNASKIESVSILKNNDNKAKSLNEVKTKDDIRSSVKKTEACDISQNKGASNKPSNGKPEVKMLNNLRVVLTSLNLGIGSKSKITSSNSNSSIGEKTKNDTENHSKISIPDISISKCNAEEIKKFAARRTSQTSENSKSWMNKNTFNNSTNEITTKMKNSSKVTDRTEAENNVNSINKLNGPLETDARQSLRKITKSDEKTSTKKADSDVTIVQERDLRERTRNMVAHTVEDSDSDVCIINEKIKAPKIKRGRGRPPLKGAQLAYLKRLQASKYLKCSECNFKTLSLSQLKAHEETHPKGRIIKCSKCDFETRLKSCMIYHAAMHSGGKKFRCSKCCYKTDILEKFLAHEAKKVYCSKCKTICHTQKELNKHIFKTHGVGKFVCDQCNFTTRDVEKMKSHVHKEEEPLESPTKHKIKRLKDSKNDEEKYVCTECYYTAPLITLLKEHIALVHSDDKSVRIKRKMSKRGRPRISKSAPPANKELDFSKYQTKYGEYLCPKCRYVSDEKLFFENHLKTHTSDDVSMFAKPAEIFKCSFCEFETEFEKMIESHLLTHTEHDSDFDGENDVPMKSDNLFDDDIDFLGFIENKKYQCSICEFQTDFENAFKRHKSLHVRKDVFNIIFSSLF